MSRPDIACVLDADPELGERLPAEDLEVARRVLLARVLVLPPGGWVPGKSWEPDGGRPAVGLLVVDGALLREVRVAGRPSTELLGAGDLLRPWDQDADLGTVPVDARWRVLARAHVAVLDHRFAAAAGRWPELLDALASRYMRRSRWLAFQLAVKQITRVEGRVLLLLWGLAERWGVVTPQGVHVRVRLTHEVLGRLVGARRPSVTTAVGALAEEGLVERVSDGYLLHGEAREALARIAGADAAAPALSPAYRGR